MSDENNIATEVEECFVQGADIIQLYVVPYHPKSNIPRISAQLQPCEKRCTNLDVSREQMTIIMFFDSLVCVAIVVRLLLKNMNE